jgi:hypothetical protein
MANITGRSGRRRRVLNEEVLSASSSHVALRAAPNDDSAAPAAPRYSEAAAANSPRVTDLLPRRYRTIALIMIGGLATTGLLAAAQHFSTQIGGVLAGPGSAASSQTLWSGLAAWIAVILLSATSLTCGLIHSIRRHRIDDYRGRYRVWRWAAILCLIASADYVAGFHAVIAEALAHHVGWTALRGGAVWWLLLAGPPLAWIAARTLADLRECRLAATLQLAASAVLLVATCSFLGWLPDGMQDAEPVTTSSTRLLGFWLLFSAVVSYARFVVLDAQGLAAARRPVAAPRQAERPANPLTVKPAQPAAEAASRDTSPAAILPMSAPARSRQWVDGSRPERDRYESNDDDADDGGRKLSKAERKQLRKLKAQRRAA